MRRFFLPALLTLLALPATIRAQQHPAEITPAEAAALPYRLSGRLNVDFAGEGFFGTATSIRRYTGLTAGHLLYDPKGGLATNLYFQSALYVTSPTTLTVSYFAVLSGYQSAADVDPDSDPAFADDMGYVLFLQPAPRAEWADFAVETDAMLNDTSFLVLGYAGETFAGNELAFVNVAGAYLDIDAPALYESDDYYTEGGMSGGPLYVTTADGLRVAAVTVAGTDVPDPALSDVRAITPAEQTLFTEAEYAHGLITSGTIKGPATVAAGGVAKYKTGVVFKDGVREGRDLPPRYDELYLQAVGAHKKLVTITKVTTGKFKLRFSGDLVSGETINLELLRNTLPRTAQTPLQTLQVTVQ